MQISINDVGGCVSANLTITKDAPIALLLGDNGASKSSVIKAIALAASGIVPTAAGRKSMLRDGASRGRIVVGGNSIDLPNDDAITSDGTTKASKYATFQTKFAEEKPAELSIFLQKLLKTEPTQEQLEAELFAAKVSKEMGSAVWARVESKGWNDSHKFYSERGRDLKNQWHGIAGLTWGSKQSANWTPGDWEPELDGKSEATLQEELVQQRETLEGMIRFEAVNEEELAKLQEEYLDLEKRKRERSEAKEELDQKEKALRSASAKLQALPRPGAPVKTVSCKKCKTEHIYSNGDIILAPEKPKVEDIEKQTKDIKEAEHEASIAGQVFAGAEAAYRRTDLAVHNAERAHERYMELMKRPKSEKPDPVLLEKQRALVARCEKRLQAFKVKTAADSKHNAVVDNQKIIDVLAPDGFRQKHSATAIEKFNQNYLSYESVSGFKEVRLAKNLDITYGGRLYKDCSDGEKWKTNAIFTIALARIQGDSILLFDKAEELDKPGKRGLCQVLASLQIPAVIAYTGTDRETSADLASMGIGASYWLANGELKPLKEAVAV